MRIALAQNLSPSSPDAALLQLEEHCNTAAHAGADLLITPELSLTGYGLKTLELMKLAEIPLLGPLTSRASELARQYNLALVVGYPEVATGSLPYNAALLISNEGEPLLNYRKTHLFGELDRRRFTPGERLMKPVEWQGWLINLAICYDVEFPEVARSLALKGTELLLVPTANMHPYTSVAQRLVPARAEENTLFVAYANYCGQEAELHYCGHSCICDPQGEDLARADADPRLLLVDLPHRQLLHARQQLTYLKDRRPALYE